MPGDFEELHVLKAFFHKAVFVDALRVGEIEVLLRSDDGVATGLLHDGEQLFAKQIVGIREVDEQVLLVSFLDFDLGFFDREAGRVEPAPNPFVPEKVLTMSPE